MNCVRFCLRFGGFFNPYPWETFKCSKQSILSFQVKFYLWVKIKIKDIQFTCCAAVRSPDTKAYSGHLRKLSIFQIKWIIRISTKPGLTPLQPCQAYNRLQPPRRPCPPKPISTVTLAAPAHQFQPPWCREITGLWLVGILSWRGPLTDILLVCLVHLLVPLPLHSRGIRQNITDNPCLEPLAWALTVRFLGNFWISVYHIKPYLDRYLLAYAICKISRL